MSFQKYQNFTSPQGELNLTFWKTHEYKLISNWMRKVIWLLINNIHMKKFNGRSVTVRKGSCLLCWMCGDSLENLGKSTWERKNNIRQVSKFLKIFGNLRENQKSSGKIRECRKVLKTTFQPLYNFFFLIFGNYQKSSEVFGRLQKILEIVAKCLKQPSSILNFF